MSVLAWAWDWRIYQGYLDRSLNIFGENYKLLYKWIISDDETQMQLTAPMASNAPKRISDTDNFFSWFPAV